MQTDKEQTTTVYTNKNVQEIQHYTPGFKVQCYSYSHFAGSDSNTGSSSNDAIMLLLAEIRSLREQLEASIQSNNSLREMLQKQLVSSSPQRQTLTDRSPARTSPKVSPSKSLLVIVCIIRKVEKTGGIT